MKLSGWMIAAALTSVGFAQDIKQSPDYQAAPAVREAARKAEGLKAALEFPQPNEKPVDRLDVNEFQLKMADYAGQVVELTFDQVMTLKQEGTAGYIAQVAYKRLDRMASDKTFVEVAVPRDGLELFQEVYDLKGTTRETQVMVQVLVESKVRALGKRYREDAPDGEKYHW